MLLEFGEAVVAPDGSSYRPRACGGEAHDGTSRWHGWIEFVPDDGGPAIRTQRETTQPNRASVAYWASGLTPRYLEGALRRALKPMVIQRHSRRPVPMPAFNGPGPDFAIADGSAREPAFLLSVRPRVVESCKSRVSAPLGPSPLTFSSVGGMHDLKHEVRRIITTIHIRRDQARRYGIVRNGILLHGPPGCGKTFFARAIAGEFGLHFLSVPLSSAVTKFVGGAPEAIHDVFQRARAQTPCLLFFDEFDAIASRRRNALTLQEQQMVDALLQELDASREVPGLLIVAATNRFEDLDPAVIRFGRFDYTVKVPEPDQEARCEILRVLLEQRPHAPSIDITRVAHDLEGFSAARIQNVVDEAALLALETGGPITKRHLRSAYRAHVSAGRWRGAKLGWDDLILPAETKVKLRFVEKFIRNPQLVRRLGVAPPDGMLLFGPPGTGKTTIARVLASVTEASFVAVNAADILSKWLGESERQVTELFARARARLPAIIFIDEIDAVLERRAEALSAGDHTRNSIVNTFLAEMDGLDSSSRVFTIGATNRAELLDEALIRSGRLGEAIEIGLPDPGGRVKLLRLFSKRMRLDDSVDLDSLAARTPRASGADLKGLCTMAGRNAFIREIEGGGAAGAVIAADFDRALDELFVLGAGARAHPIGFQPSAPA